MFERVGLYRGMCLQNERFRTLHICSYIKPRKAERLKRIRRGLSIVSFIQVVLYFSRNVCQRVNNDCVTVSRNRYNARGLYNSNWPTAANVFTKMMMTFQNRKHLLVHLLQQQVRKKMILHTICWVYYYYHIAYYHPIWHFLRSDSTLLFNKVKFFAQ